MIVFDGYLTGAAEKFFFSKSRKFGLILMAISFSFVLTPIILYAIKTRNLLLLGIVSLCCILIYLLTLIPKSKKEKAKLLPQKVYTDKESIICIGRNYSESRLIGEETALRDHGEFYELVYPFGRYSEKFICQKSLLSQGTLEEFETLFENKIVRISKTEDGSVSSSKTDE